MHVIYEDIDDTIKFVLDTALKEAKEETRLTKQLLITILSAYSNNPINLLVNARSGVGKNYVINKIASLFPEYDIVSLAGMTDKALFHRSGTLVIKNEIGEYISIEDKIKELDDQIDDKEHEKSQTNDRTLKHALQEDIDKLYSEKKELLKDSKKLIDLSNKTLIFLDTPRQSLLNGLLPLLSHDKYEVEYEYADTYNGIKTKSNVLRGWPAVICAQALDYSDSPRFPEYQRRFITTNPTISKEKFKQAIELTADKSSNPDFIYQIKVVSDDDKDRAREIIKGLKEQILDIYKNVNPGKNNVIIPFNDSIIELLPKERAEDMTRANRLYTYLSFLPSVYFHKRPRLTLVKQGDISIQTIPIATFDDLQTTISLMEYSDGVRPEILEWYYDVFLEAYKDKGDTKDSKVVDSKGNSIKEKRTAVTSRELIEKHKENSGEVLTTKRILGYLDPLANHGYIDKLDSELDRRAKIYYPIIETKKYKNLFLCDERNNLLQETKKIVVKSTKYPDKVFMLFYFETILKYSSEKGYILKIKNSNGEEISLEELVKQYFSNPEDYFEVKKEIESQKKEENDEPDKKKENETPEEKYNREQKEIQGWG